jgi:hypothetical protein
LGAESSRPKRRFGASAIGGMAAAAFVVLVSDPAASQTPSTNLAAASTDLLQPSLQGNPATLPRFRKPGQKRPSAEEPPPTNTFAPNRIGATPTYGSPSGLGAADTGFDSLNVSRAKRKTPAPPPVLRTIVPQPPETTFTPVPTYNPAIAPPPAPQQIKVPPPEVYPLRAAMRVGATLPPPPPPLQEELVNNPPPEVHPLAAANRPGSSLAAPGPQFYTYAVSSYLPDYVANPPPPNLQPPNTFALGQRPQRLLPILAEPDPYAALGIRAGSFILLPSLDFSGAASTNPEHIPGGPPAAYVVAAPELIVRSDWERHSLTADIAGSWTQYTQDLVPSLNVPYMNSRVDGRIDVTRDTAINLQLRGIINTDNPGSPNTQFGVAQLPINFDVGQTVGITQQFNRLSVLRSIAPLTILRCSPTANIQATPTATLINMAASAALLTNSIRACGRSCKWKAISACTTSRSIATTCSASRSASPEKSVRPSTCSARSPVEWRSAMSIESTKIRHCPRSRA